MVALTGVVVMMMVVVVVVAVHTPMRMGKVILMAEVNIALIIIFFLMIIFLIQAVTLTAAAQPPNAAFRTHPSVGAGLARAASVG